MPLAGPRWRKSTAARSAVRRPRRTPRDQRRSDNSPGARPVRRPPPVRGPPRATARAPRKARGAPRSRSRRAITRRAPRAVEQPVAEFTHRAAAARGTGHVLCRRQHLRVRVGDRRGQPDCRHQAEIRRVVDEACDATCVNGIALQEFRERARLVADALGDVADAEFAHARGDRGRAAARRSPRRRRRRRPAS